MRDGSVEIMYSSVVSFVAIAVPTGDLGGGDGDGKDRVHCRIGKRGGWNWY